MKLDKIKLLTTVVVLLVLMNIATLAGMWKLMQRDFHAPPPGPKEFLIAKLQLDEEQQKVFETLRKEHFDQMRVLQENIRSEKDEMYDLLKSDNPDTTATYGHIAQIMREEEQLERITFEHFRKVRAICNDDQKQHFDAIIDRVMQMVMRPPRPGEPHGPHRRSHHEPLP